MCSGEHESNRPRVTFAFREGWAAMHDAGKVYTEYRSKLLAFIRQQVGDRDLAEDVLHDVFVKIVGRDQCSKEPGKMAAWLYQVTRNAIIDRFRSNKQHEQLPHEIEASEEAPTAEARLAGFLRPMIDTLPRVYRDSIIFSELDGIPLKQIAEREGISVSAVKSRVQRGRRMLKAMLRECCLFEFSRDGAIMDFWPKSDGSCRCNSLGNGSRAFTSAPVAEESRNPASRLSR
jgi:RNA polymerase sigma-70 factor, ECF subfamily